MVVYGINRTKCQQAPTKNKLDKPVRINITHLTSGSPEGKSDAFRFAEASNFIHTAYILDYEVLPPPFGSSKH